MPHLVKVGKSAARELAKLPKEAQKSIVEALESLGKTPRPLGVEKLKANPTFLRLRVGNYRVIYAVDDARGLVAVVVIRDRKDAFKGFGALDAKLEKVISAMADQILEHAATRAPV